MERYNTFHHCPGWCAPGWTPETMVSSRCTPETMVSPRQNSTVTPSIVKKLFEPWHPFSLCDFCPIQLTAFNWHEWGSTPYWKWRSVVHMDQNLIWPLPGHLWRYGWWRHFWWRLMTPSMAHLIILGMLLYGQLSSQIWVPFPLRNLRVWPQYDVIKFCYDPGMISFARSLPHTFGEISEGQLRYFAVL